MQLNGRSLAGPLLAAPCKGLAHSSLGTAVALDILASPCGMALSGRFVFRLFEPRVFSLSGLWDECSSSSLQLSSAAPSSAAFSLTSPCAAGEMGKGEKGQSMALTGAGCGI